MFPVPSRRVFAAAAAFAVFAAAFILAVGGGPDRVLGAQIIDPTSCGGAGNPNCLNLPANVTIGANSCTVLGACNNLGDGVSIGAGSCDAVTSCGDVGAAVSIGASSCTGLSACFQAGLDGVGAGFATIGAGSCIGNSSCSRAGYGRFYDGHVEIGDGACVGPNACSDLGLGSDQPAHAEVGDGSCHDYFACESPGAQFEVGEDSCSGAQACKAAGSVGESQIGNRSCVGVSACEATGSHGTASIGDDSCNAEAACDHTGAGNYNDATPPIIVPGAVTIGDHSCNSFEGCLTAGEGGTATIGQLSCSRGELFFEQCTGPSVTVGDCIYNSPAVPCATVTVTKDFTDNSNASVEIALACADADSVSANGTEELGDGDSVAYLVAFNRESVSCQLGETGPPGYVTSVTCGDTPVQQGSLTLNLIAGDAVQCTFTNTPIGDAGSSVTVLVRKDFADHSSATVEVSLVCGEAISVTPEGSEQLGDGDSVTYTVAFRGDSVACELSETGVPGYDSFTGCIGADAVVAPSLDLTLVPGENRRCGFTNIPFGFYDDPATVTVRKVFTDHSRGTIDVHLVCGGAEVSADGSQRLGDGDSVTYEVTLEADSVRCEVSESGGEGYYSSTACIGAGPVRRGSLAFDLEAGASVQCTFTNAPVDSGDEEHSGGHGGANGGTGSSNGSGCTNGILAGTRPPATGGFGTFAFCGGTFEALLAASGCPNATSVFFNNKIDGSFAAWVPGTEVAVANEAILALFAGTPPIPSGTIFTARCV